jgi:hypothetical protein
VFGPGVVVHTCNPNSWVAEAGGAQRGLFSKTKQKEVFDLTQRDAK